ncbi:transposase, partial [Aurantimonas sp. E1-2-R+4]|uniref:transposase n=1 Tax=Aurantimonas sp. E1-2-R+4 TaxID=3113714 RepID=UPI002F93D2BD
MGSGNFTDDFKRDAVTQITERGYSVAEVSKRLGVSQHSLYTWRRKFSKPSGSADVDQAAEIRRLKRDLGLGVPPVPWLLRMLCGFHGARISRRRSSSRFPRPYIERLSSFSLF